MGFVQEYTRAVRSANKGLAIVLEQRYLDRHKLAQAQVPCLPDAAILIQSGAVAHGTQDN